MGETLKGGQLCGWSSFFLWVDPSDRPTKKRVSDLGSADPRRVFRWKRPLLGSERPGLAGSGAILALVAQRVPAVGEVPARQDFRGRIAASVEGHAFLAVGAVWVVWLGAVFGVVIGG